MKKHRIGALVFDGFEMLDLYGPLEIFCMHPDAFEIVIVAEDADPVRATGGPATKPDVTFDTCGAFDILLVPGGAGTRRERENQRLLDWIAQQAKTAELVTSVCTGSLLLARAGVLDGQSATTNKIAFDWVVDHADGPTINWHRKARWVESGKYFTASGVSAGIDMSLAVVEAVLGHQAAEDAANWAEYSRNRDATNDPFSRFAETNKET